MTANRRQFSKALAAATTGLLFAPCDLLKATQPSPGPSKGSKRRRVTVAGRRIKTVDIHAHCQIPETWELVKDFEWGRSLKTNLDNREYGRQSSLAGVEERLAVMDAWGIDVQALSINPVFWYAAERDIATTLVGCL